MKRRIGETFWLACLGFLLIIGIENASGGTLSLLPQNAVLQIPRGCTVVYNQLYAFHGNIPLFMDLYFPPRARILRKIVVFIHGGGWEFGDKYPCPALYLLSRGFAVASINYRLSWQAKFPAQLEDCKAAVRFLRVFSGPFGIDPRAIGVMGESAGAHLSALLGAEGEGLSSVQAVVAQCGPYNFLSEVEQAERSCCCRRNAWTPDSFETKLLGFRPPENEAVTRTASPTLLISRGRRFPPILILHGLLDQLVPHEQAVEFHEKLQAAGKISLLLLNNRDHAVTGPGEMRVIADYLPGLLTIGQEI